MVIYDDRQFASCMGAPLWQEAHRDLIWTTILNIWCNDSHRAERALVESFEDLQRLMDYGAISSFYDRYGRYVGHAILVKMDPANEARILSNPDAAFDSSAWQHGPHDWMLHFEARNGAALEMGKRIRDRIREGSGRISYVQSTSFDVGISCWEFDKCLSSPEVCSGQSKVEIEAWMGQGASERAGQAEMLSLLATRKTSPISLKQAMHLTYWARNLQQFVIAGRSTLLIWAWCNERALRLIREKKMAYPPGILWNCGDTPVLICAIGEQKDLDPQISAWRKSLACDANLPRKLGFDGCLEWCDLEDA